MNIKKAANSELSKTESTNKLTKQTTRTGTESQLWTPFGGLSAGRAKGENGGKCTGIRKHKLQVQNRQGDVMNNIDNGEAK